MQKKFIILNIFLTFIMGFFVHGIYGWFPSVVTSIFPINESLFEHMKLIFWSPILSVLLLLLYFKHRNISFNNIFFGLAVNIFFNIIIFYLIYLPVYHAYGSNLVLTLIIYFITIILSNYLYYLIINMNNNNKLNFLSIIFLVITNFILIYFTYHPLKIDFFKDPTNNDYGINAK